MYLLKCFSALLLALVASCMLLPQLADAQPKITYKYEGVAVQVDAEKYTLTVKQAKGEPFVLRVRQSADIIVNGKGGANFRDVRKDDRVVVLAEGDRGTTSKQVVRIEAKR